MCVVNCEQLDLYLVHSCHLNEPEGKSVLL